MEFLIHVFFFFFFLVSKHSVFWDDMICSINAGLPSILRGRVIVRRTGLALDTVEVLPVCTARNGIVVPEETPLPQLGKQKLDDIDKCTRLDSIRLKTQCQL